MKYIVGASIGGLFGFGAPFMVEINQAIDAPTIMVDSRLEDSQQPEEMPPRPIDDALILPDISCGYYISEAATVEERLEECIKLSREHSNGSVSAI